MKEIVTVTAGSSGDLADVLAEHLERAEPDLLRSMLQTFVPALVGAEADAVCGRVERLHAVERGDWPGGTSWPLTHLLPGIKRPSPCRFGAVL